MHPVSDFEQVIIRIEDLPDEGEGMTIDEIAKRVDSEPSYVVSALEEMIEREEHKAPER